MKQITRLTVAFCAAALLTFLTASTLRAQEPSENDLVVGLDSSDQTTNFTSGTHTYVNTYVGYALFDSSSNNTLGVYNAGTLLTNSADPDVFDTGFLYVGYQGSTGNSLVISNGGTVAAAGDGYIGDSSFEAGNNTALVTGSGSLLTIGDPSDPFSFGGNFYVGSSSSGNSLVISNGGTVSANYSEVGGTSSNNSVLVTGTNSLWTSSNSLTIGVFGRGNSLTVADGGTVESEGGSIVGLGSAASNNTALVTGTNSLWNTGQLLVGHVGGSGNSLVISSSGTVSSTWGYVGWDNSNNTVLVTDGGTWTNSRTLYVGHGGSGNSLTVADGGTARAEQGIRIAEQAGSSGTLNIGRFGTNDTAGTILAPTIAFGAGTGAINFNQSDAVTITSSISGAGTLHQLGGGATILSASNTYTGATTVSAGQLVVDGSIAGSTVTVNNGGTLTGSGAVGGIVLNLGSTISPGNSPGTLAVAGNSVWNAGANYNWQLYDTALGAGTGWDLVNATGTLDLTALTVGSEFNINLWSLADITPDANGPALNFDPNQNYTWTILTAAGGISGFTGGNQFDINIGAFNGTAGFANGLDGGSFSVAQSGNDLNLVFTSAGGAPIPEPGTWAAAALLVGGAAFLRWRKRKQVA